MSQSDYVSLAGKRLHVFRMNVFYMRDSIYVTDRGN